MVFLLYWLFFFNKIYEGWFGKLSGNWGFKMKYFNKFFFYENCKIIGFYDLLVNFGFLKFKLNFVLIKNLERYGYKR